jgi:hypothetical protein
MKYLIFVFLIVSFTKAFAQPTQIIRGVVINQSSNLPVPFASIAQLGTSAHFGTKTDSLGNFTIQNVPVGRYDLKVTCVGFEPTIVREIVVISAKQTFLTITLKENNALLNEVVVRPKVNKEQPLNAMATVSARMLSVEEAKRYAGGFDDPARLASSFAGVASNSGVNGIIVRGNAPKFLQWKMEGIEIPNPNHFGDLQTYGGGTLTALSSQMLANSDFLTGAFPAEYNNALSGVFDIALRKGNNQKREHTFQIGIVGIDASSEGYFKKGSNSSYLFNYRYSTLALLQPLLPEGANQLKYQDLSFKLNFPTKNIGTFSVWGIGLLDAVGAKAKTDSTKWKYYDDKENNDIKLSMAAVGVSHKLFISNTAYLKTTLAITTNQTDWATEALNAKRLFTPRSNISVQNSNFILSSFLNKTFGVTHTNKTGILLTGMWYNLLLNKSDKVGTPLKEIVNSDGFSFLLSAYSNSSISLSDKLLMNVGINTQFFTLNNNFTVEPRIGLRYEIKQNHSLGVAYGLHSRLEQLNFYFNNSLSTNQKTVNKNLDFTKAHHFVLSYDWNISDLVHLKIEPYYQQLFAVPVTAKGSFSVLNLQTDWFFAEKLQNTGEGKNYGIDLTLEKYMSNGYYYLLTASAFKSEYKGGDNIWRSTRFDRNYVFNFLVGKEWQVGVNKQNTFSLNTKLSYQGGNRYSPINVAASNLAKEPVFDETNAYQMQMEPAFNMHFTASFKKNKQNSSREIALKIVNLTGQSDFNGFKYNFINKAVDKDLASVVLPNLSYKIEF